MKTLLVFSFLLILCGSAYAERCEISFSSSVEDSLQSAEVGKFLNRTKNGISTAKKHELANNLPASNDIILAGKLSQYAEELLQNHNYNGAIQCSRKARDLVVQTLTNYLGQEKALKYDKYPLEYTSYIQETIDSDTTTLQDWVNQLH